MWLLWHFVKSRHARRKMYFYVSHESSFRFPHNQDLNKENWNISYYSFYECRLRQFNPANLNNDKIMVTFETRYKNNPWCHLKLCLNQLMDYKKKNVNYYIIFGESWGHFKLWPKKGARLLQSQTRISEWHVGKPKDILYII